MITLLSHCDGCVARHFTRDPQLWRSHVQAHESDEGNDISDGSGLGLTTGRHIARLNEPVDTAKQRATSEYTPHYRTKFSLHQGKSYPM